MIEEYIPRLLEYVAYLDARILDRQTGLTYTKQIDHERMGRLASIDS